MGGPGGLPSRFWRKFKQFWVIFGQINVGTKIEPKYCQRTKSVTKKLSEPKKLHKEPNSSFLVPLLPSLASLDCDLHRFRYSFTHSTFHNECANSLVSNASCENSLAASFCSVYNESLTMLQKSSNFVLFKQWQTNENATLYFKN